MHFVFLLVECFIGIPCYKRLGGYLEGNIRCSWVIYHAAQWFREPDTVSGYIGWKILEALGGLPLVYLSYFYYSRGGLQNL